jgi:hypothetical protein
MTEYDQDVQQTQSTEHTGHFHRAYSYYDHEVQAVHFVQDQIIQTVTEYNEHATQFHRYGSCSHQEIHAVPHMQDQITQTDTETAHAGQHEGSNSGPGDVVCSDMSPLIDECISNDYTVCYATFNLSSLSMLTCLI